MERALVFDVVILSMAVLVHLNHVAPPASLNDLTSRVLWSVVQGLVSVHSWGLLARRRSELWLYGVHALSAWRKIA